METPNSDSRVVSSVIIDDLNVLGTHEAQIVDGQFTITLPSPDVQQRTPRVLLAVVTCEEYKHRQNILKQTWAKNAPTVEFFDGERLDVDDSYEALPQKIKALCRYALENGFDYLWKCDDDTYLRPELIPMNPGSYHGRRRGPSDGFPSDYCSGGFYGLDATAMRIIVNAPLTADTAEDRWVGNTLALAGILPTDDPQIIVPVPHNKMQDIGNKNFIALMQLDEHSPRNAMQLYFQVDHP